MATDSTAVTRTKRTGTKRKSRTKQYPAQQSSILTSDCYPGADAAEDLSADVAILSEWEERIERRVTWLRPRYRPAQELREKEKPIEAWLTASLKSGQQRVAEYFGQEPELLAAMGRLMLVFPDEIQSIDWGANWVNASVSPAHESPTDDEILPVIDSLEELAAQIKYAVKRISSQLIESQEPTEPTPPDIVDVIETFWCNVRQLQIFLRAEQAKLVLPRPEYVSQKANELRDNFVVARKVFDEWKSRFAKLHSEPLDFCGESSASYAGLVVELMRKCFFALESRRLGYEQPQYCIVTTDFAPYDFSADDVETLRQWFEADEVFRFSGSRDEQVQQIHKRLGKLLIGFRQECAWLDPLGELRPAGLKLGTKANEENTTIRHNAIVRVLQAEREKHKQQAVAMSQPTTDFDAWLKEWHLRSAEKEFSVKNEAGGYSVVLIPKDIRTVKKAINAEALNSAE